MPTLQIQLLDTFHLHYDDEPLTSPHQARLQSLLAYLILHCHLPQARQHIAFLFWPDSTEAQAHRNLRRSLHHLRSMLPDLNRFLHIDAKTVQWRSDAPYLLDVALFERKLAQADNAEATTDTAGARTALQEAVELYRGDLLPTCYDDWIVPERERLRERFLGALTRLIDEFEQSRDYAEAILYANRLLRADPLHETAYRRLMRLHALNDDRAAALRTYHTCATMLQRELGVDPSPPTQESYAHLLHLETPPAGSHAKLRGDRQQDALIGRQSEWKRLQVAWQRAAHSHTHCVIIASEAGIGKTRLAEELTRWADHQGVTTARTRAYAAEGSLAYAPVIDWLRTEAVQAGWAHLDPAWLGELGRLLPDVLVDRLAPPQSEPLSERWQRQRLFQALSRAILSAKLPLLLVLDDMQWCDQETLEWLHYLLRFDLHARLLVVGTVRLDEVDADHPLTPFLLNLRGGDQLTEIELGPLTVDETAALAAQVATRPLAHQMAQDLYQTTEGNPLFVTETVRATLPDNNAADSTLHTPLALLPLKVHAVIHQHLTRLSPAARELANLAAVIGHSFTWHVLVQASGLDETTLVQSLDELWQRRIIREQGSDGYDFSHDQIREVAYAGISPARRRRLHCQAAQALEQIHDADLDLVSACIAVHYRQAGYAAKAAAYYFRAASKMEFGFAYGEMIAHLRQGLAALRTEPHTKENVTLEIAMLLALGRILTAREGWGSPGAVDAFERARHLCLGSNNLAQLVRTQNYLQTTYADSGNLRRALALAESTVELAVKLGDVAEIEGAHGGLGLLLYCVGEFAEARDHLEQAAALAVTSPEAQASAHRALSYPGAFPHVLVLWLLGYPDAAQRYLQDVLAAQEAHAGPFDLLSGYEYCVMFYHWRRDYGEMQAYAQKLVVVAETYEFVTYRWLGHLYVSAASSALGEPTEDSVPLRQSVEALIAHGVRMFVPYNLCLLAEVCVRAGQFTEGKRALDEALAMEAETGEHLWEAETHRLRGDLWRAEGAIQDAEFAYQQALAVACRQKAKSLELRAALSLSRLWEQQGRRQLARELLAELCQWFVEGFDTPELTEARTLVAALAA